MAQLLYHRQGHSLTSNLGGFWENFKSFQGRSLTLWWSCHLPRHRKFGVIKQPCLRHSNFVTELSPHKPNSNFSNVICYLTPTCQRTPLIIYSKATFKQILPSSQICTRNVMPWNEMKINRIKSHMANNLHTANRRQGIAHNLYFIVKVCVCIKFPSFHPIRQCFYVVHKAPISHKH